MGDDRFVDALADGRITLTGPREVTRRIPDWFGQHPILANVERGLTVQPLTFLGSGRDNDVGRSRLENRRNDRRSRQST